MSGLNGRDQDIYTVRKPQQHPRTQNSAANESRPLYFPISPSLVDCCIYMCMCMCECSRYSPWGLGIHTVVDEGRGHEMKCTSDISPPLLLVCIRIGLECVFSARETRFVPKLCWALANYCRFDHLHCILGSLRLYSVATSQLVGSMIRYSIRLYCYVVHINSYPGEGSASCVLRTLY